MHYIINPWIFYLFNLVGNLETLLIVFLVFAGVFTVFIMGCFILEDDFKHPLFITAKKLILPLIIAAFLLVLLPSKDTMTEMLVASYVTTENIDKAAVTGKDIVDYITEKVVEMKKEEGAK
jgi:phage-related holin